MVKTRWTRLIFIISLGVLWQIVALYGPYNPMLVPSLNDIGLSFIGELINGSLIGAVTYSFYIIIKGLVIAFILAIILVLLSRTAAYLDDIVELLITIAHPLPGIAILPLVILWFGIGESAVVFVVVHSMLWPIVITLKAGLVSLYQKFARIADAFSLNRWKRIIHLYGMGLVPSAITGAKIGWSRGWRAFISAEMVFGIVGNHSGLGWYLFEQRVYMNSPKLFAGLLTIILCGLFIEKAVFEKAEAYVARRWC